MDVLVVDDDTAFVQPLLRALRDKSLTVDTAADVTEAIRLIARKSFRVVTLGLLLNAGSGFDVIDFIKTQDFDRLAVVVVTAAEPSLLGRLDRNVVKTVLFKPANAEQVAAYVHLLSLR